MFFIFEIGDLILISIFLLCGLGLIFSIRGIWQAVRESAATRLRAEALVTGDLMSFEKEKRTPRIKKQGIGLRKKFIFYTITLVFAVNMLVSIPFYNMMTENQRQTLIRGLWDRSAVLMEGLVANARIHLAAGNLENMNFLPSQMISLPEARYVTITGYNLETLVFEEQIWATNNPGIMYLIDTPVFKPGYSRLNDVISPRLPALFTDLNNQARAVLLGVPHYIEYLLLEARELSAQEITPEIERRLDVIRVTVGMMEMRIEHNLTRISPGIGSVPEFCLENLVIPENHRFLLYKPILGRLGSEDNFFWGIVRLEISISPILAEIAEGQRNLMMVNLLIALIAQIIGIIGAWILSTLMIRPVMQLAKHVEYIRDTDDIRKLSNIEINMKTKDELAGLGNTINDMTRGLVKAAQAASDLSIGKEVQKKFIPLELDQEGNKLSSGFEETTNLSIFGYYEGAKGVSGDYYDYQDLDGRYYAIIKGDVAGKGIPAAFIMIQVATMFLSYFRKWEPTEKGMQIEELVYQINELIENLAFKDRFTAFTLCLYDSLTGVARFCNAGDNIVNIFDASEKRFKTITLPETPAVGMFSNLMVESKGGYSVQTITLDPGDILFLYTDGIEESKRKFRNKEFEEITCKEVKADTPHGNHVGGQGSEEFGNDRIQDIINAVMNKKVYSLRKWHNPEREDKVLQFDFRSCKGTVREVIMALVSVEKMFRCYYNPKTPESGRVLVDKIVDSFLKEHFVQYRQYCYATQENPGNKAYMYYTRVMEDEQYDDLTILGFKRK